MRRFGIYRNFDGTPERKRQLERSRHRCDCNISTNLNKTASVWTWFAWPSIRPGSSLLREWQRILLFHKIWGFYSLTYQLPAFQNAFCSMEIVFSCLPKLQNPFDGTGYGRHILKGITFFILSYYKWLFSERPKRTILHFVLEFGVILMEIYIRRVPL